MELEYNCKRLKQVWFYDSERNRLIQHKKKKGKGKEEEDGKAMEFAQDNLGKSFK